MIMSINLNENYWFMIRDNDGDLIQFVWKKDEAKAYLEDGHYSELITNILLGMAK